VTALVKGSRPNDNIEPELREHLKETRLNLVSQLIMPHPLLLPPPNNNPSCVANRSVIFHIKARIANGKENICQERVRDQGSPLFFLASSLVRIKTITIKILQLK
jgi:hypothetical protein